MSKPKDLVALIRSVDAGNPPKEDVAALRKILIDEPEALDLVGNLAITMTAVIIGGPMFTPAMRVGLNEQCDAMRAGMGWAESTTLEKTLIDHVILCWLRYHETEWRYNTIVSKEHTLTLGAHWEKRITSAQKRYLRAAESLAKVRKLLRPDKNPIFAMQLNQQIHT